MRLPPLPPETLNAELRNVHDTIVNMVTGSMPDVVSLDAKGALIGPYAPMLHFPTFGVPALQFIAAVNANSRLPKAVREITILTVGAVFNAQYELYAHEIMGGSVGLSPAQVATLAAGSRPADLTDHEAVAHDVARALATGRVLPTSTYNLAAEAFGSDGVAELVFLTGSYCLIAVVLNAFDVPAPEIG
jgi:4-carboxymuconolactone decarboxylase